MEDSGLKRNMDKIDFEKIARRAGNEFRGRSRLGIANKLFLDSVQKSFKDRELALRVMKSFQNENVIKIQESMNRRSQMKVHSKVTTTRSDHSTARSDHYDVVGLFQPLNEIQVDLKRLDSKSSAMFHNIHDQR